MRLITILLLASIAFGQRTRPSMIVTPDLLTAMKQRARSNTAQWAALYGSNVASQSCQWAVQYTAATPDHLPPVYAYREPTAAYGGPAGAVSTGDAIGYYQGGGASKILLNLGACYLTLKDGDVDLAGSPAGTADELASANLYAAQAAKIVNKFTYPYARITPATPPAKWEGFDWMPAFYVDLHPTDATGCTLPGERRVLVDMRQHALAAGATVTLTGILGGLSALNGQSFQVSANGLTALQFELEQGGAPVCSSLTGTNYNTDYLDDDAFPLRYGVSAPALAYDWFFNHAAFTPAVKAQVADSFEAWFRHTMILDSSARLLYYESRTQSNYHWGFFNAYGLAGIALKGDDARADVWFHHWRNVMLLGRDQPYLKRWLSNSGSFMESFQYFSLGMQMLVVTILADETALGDTLINHPTQPLAPFLLGQLEYLKQSLQPNGHSILQRNTTGYPNGASQVPFESNRISTVALYPLSYLADRENSPLKNKFRKLVQDLTTYAETATGYPAPEGTDYWSIFMFWNPTGTMENWDDAALSKANMSNPLGTYQHVFMRSDWTTSGVYASFYGGIPTADNGNGKEAMDRGALQVQRGETHLLVNPRAECLRGLPQTYTGNEAQANNAMACYGAMLNQSSNVTYIGGTSYGIYYSVKPGQQDGPFKYGIQTGKPQFLGSMNPWLPGTDSLPDQVLPVTADPATDTFTVTTLPTGANLAAGYVAYITYGDGLTEGAPIGGLSRGTKYFLRSVSGSTFKLATTNSDSTIVNVTSAGTGPQFVVTGKGPANTLRHFTVAHPVTLDRYAAGSGYVYSRAVNLHQMYINDPVYTTHYALRNWTREVLYLRPKVFVVYDRTEKLPKSTGTTRNISAVGNVTPVCVTTAANHGYHTGMTVTVAGSDVAGINGAHTITVTGATTFTLDGTTAAGAGTAAGTVSGTVLYQPTMAWMTGKTPQLADSSNGMFRYLVSDESTLKGAITAVLPVTKTTSVRDVGDYGLLHQILVAAPMTSDTNNFLTVVDVADTLAKVDAVTRLNGTGIDAAIIGTNRVAGFLTGTTVSLPVSYRIQKETPLTHYVAGFGPGVAYSVSLAADGQVSIESLTASGKSITAGVDGVLIFSTSSTGIEAGGDHGDGGSGGGSGGNPPPPVALIGALSRRALIRYVAPDQQVCTLEVSESPGFETLIDDINPAVHSGADRDKGGRIVRSAALGTRSPLAPATTYHFRARCGSIVLQTSFRTKAAEVAGPINLPFQSNLPARLRATSMTVEYGYKDGELNQSVVLGCTAACSTTLPVTSGNILFVRRLAKNAQGVTVVASSVETILVP